jgi:phosphoribosylamine--glycine ligase
MWWVATSIVWTEMATVSPANRNRPPIPLVPPGSRPYDRDERAKHGRSMNILILGGGGREHALAWAVKQNPKCDRLIVAPGNAGIAMLAECADIDILDGGIVATFCEENAVDFVIVGPEAPLAAGVADATRAAGILTFGPSAAAAQLEASKAFTKEICDSCGAPTAGYARFTEAAAARAYIQSQGAPIVIKADGLAAGKGVVVAMTLAEALAAVDDMLGGQFGAAGAEVVVEEFMAGEEASFFVLTDGTHALPIGTAQDHKRAFDGDTGPNTGGMGAYSPAPVLTEAVQRQAMAEIILPTIAEMARRGTPYQGVLYAGLMIEGGRARLVEYNARFGDPECQVMMMRLGAQALDLLLACAEGRLQGAQVTWAPDHALTVVMAARGYPGDYAKGSVIGGLDALPEDSRRMVFHAGTRAEGADITANGGRVLNVTARGDTLAAAREAAYAMIDRIDWPGGFCRRDIGWRAL